MRRGNNRLLDSLVVKIRNTKWLRTLPVYEIEMAEERYQAMAEKGWLLKKQGSSWERYERGTPRNRSVHRVLPGWKYTNGCPERKHGDRYYLRII